nr:hypothetical protein [Parabacteroides distasonis]
MLLQLIDDILDFSKIEAGTMDYHFEEVDIKDMWRNRIGRLYKDAFTWFLSLISAPHP